MSFPLYEMIVNGRQEWHTLRDAGVVYDYGHFPVAIGGKVLDRPGMPRDITEEERRRISDIADEWSASKSALSHMKSYGSGRTARAFICLAATSI